MLELQATSPLGHARAAMGKTLFSSPQLNVAEAPWTRVFSLRLSRSAADRSTLEQCLHGVSLKAPAQPNTLDGNADHGCAWVEPRAWLLYSRQNPSPGAAPGLLVTEISDRICIFTVSGSRARELISAGCDAQIVPLQAAVRTRFGSVANAIIERHAEHEYRLTFDVSLAPALADWLVEAAGNL